jgi:phage terminase small subunit
MGKNVKRERFAQELAKGKTQVEAYKIAGYSPNDSNAAKLANKPEIQERITEINGKALARAELEAELTVASMLKRAGKIATVDIDPKDVKPSDALNAIKFVTERLAPLEQANITNNVLILSKDEIARRLIYLLQKPEEGE